MHRPLAQPSGSTYTSMSSTPPTRHRTGGIGWCVLLMVAVFVPWGQQAQAQAGISDVVQDPGYINDFTRPGELSMIVFIWGAAGNPGIWRVERDVDLLALLSAAGVSSRGVSSNNAQQALDIATRTSIRIFRSRGDTRDVIYEERIEDLLRNGGSYPALQEGDIIEIESVPRRRVTWRTTLEFFRTISSAATLYLFFRELSGL